MIQNNDKTTSQPRGQVYLLCWIILMPPKPDSCKY